MRVTPAMADWMVCSSHARRLTVVQGRFLAALEMTIWGRRPCEGATFLHDRCVAP